MKPAALALAAVLIASPALADPLMEALQSNGGAACFEGTYAAPPPGQTVKRVLMSLDVIPDWPGAATLRLKLEGLGKPIYVHGGCSWREDDLNRGGSDRILIASFGPRRGVSCIMTVDLTGASAEEAGSFPMDWKDGQSVEFHLPSMVAGWRTTNTSREAKFFEVGEADRIFLLARVDNAGCSELRATFAPTGS